MRQHVLAGNEAPSDIQVECLMPLVFAQFDRTAHGGIAHVVVQHVNPAMPCNDIIHDLFDLFGSRNVADCSTCRPALGRNDFDSFLCCVRVEIDTDNMRAFAREERRCRLSVTPTRAYRAGTEHDCDFALETTGHDESQNSAVVIVWSKSASRSIQARSP